MPLGANSNGGVSPLSGPSNGLTANGIARGLMDVDAERIRAQIIPMYVTMNATTTSGYDTYRVPTTHDFVIEEVRAHLVLVDLANLAGADDAGGGLIITAGRLKIDSYRDRMALMANNALIDLKNTDREQKVIDNHSASVGLLHNLCGGSPINFGATPQKVPAGESLRLDVRFADTTVNVITSSVQYGIVLVGKLIRVAKS